MKKAADGLRDIDEPVAESTLVLNLLRGLNPHFINIADYIAGMNLDFADALVKLSKLAMPPGSTGEIRKTCRATNY